MKKNGKAMRDRKYQKNLHGY